MTSIRRLLAAHGGAGRLPGVSLLLAAIALLVYASPALTDLLEWSDTAGAWEGWRIVTCHWTHFSGEHLLWDVLVFVVLGSIAELRSRRRMLTCVAVSALAIGLALHAGLIELAGYRGLSGIDSALFVMLAVGNLRRGSRYAVAGLVLFAGKTAFEIVTGDTLFADIASVGVTPVPVAHAIGGAVGLVVAVFPRGTRGRLAVLAPAICLSGCAVPRATDVTFETHEIDTGVARRQTVVTGSFLGGLTTDLAVVSADEPGEYALHLYAFTDGQWAVALETALSPEVVFVDVAGIDGRDRLIMYEPGRLSWFDPESATEHALVAVTTDFNPPSRGDVLHVDVTQDVNGDGRDDLVVPDVDGFRVFVQRDDGAFADPVEIGTGLKRARIYGADGYRYRPWIDGRVHEMDYDRDGRIDLIFWNEDHFEVHQQDERGLFAPVATTFTTDVAFDSDDLAWLVAPKGIRNRRRDQEPAGVMSGRVLNALGDFNGDGVGDLAVFSLGGGSLWHLYSTYEVHFGAPTPDGGTAFASDADTTIRSDGILFDMTRHDLDHDGQVEMMFSTLNPEVFTIIGAILTSSLSFDLDFYRMADGHYTDRPDARRRMKAKFPPPEVSRTKSIFPAALIGDVNGDGRSDLLAQHGLEQLRIFVGVAGPELFERRPQKVKVAMPRDEEYTWLVDIDKDGKQDIIMHHASTTEPHRVTMLIAR